MKTYISIINVFLITSAYARITYKTTQISSEELREPLITKESDIEITVRKIREPEVVATTNSINIKPNDKGNAPIIKKPVPQYKDTDAGKELKLRLKFSEENEHYNEDNYFNIEGYDFDENNDELTGRGNPHDTIPKTKFKRSNINTHSRNIDSKQFSAPKISKKMSRQIHGKLKEEEYDDFFDSTQLESTIKTSTSNHETETTDEDYAENEFKGSVRIVRSPWNLDAMVDNIEKKTSAAFTKLLGFLPMFPKLPKDVNLKIW